MWNILYSTQFKKDLKKYKRQSSKINALKSVLLQLQEKGTVDTSYKPHPLIGDYKGCLECHIQNDFLLIWINSAEKSITLIRLGSHSELYK